MKLAPPRDEMFLDMLHISAFVHSIVFNLVHKFVFYKELQNFTVFWHYCKNKSNMLVERQWSIYLREMSYSLILGNVRGKPIITRNWNKRSFSEADSFIYQTLMTVIKIHIYVILPLVKEFHMYISIWFSHNTAR